jgi:hypothetical protein
LGGPENVLRKSEGRASWESRWTWADGARGCLIQRLERQIKILGTIVGRIGRIDDCRWRGVVREGDEAGETARVT